MSKKKELKNFIQRKLTLTNVTDHI